MFSASHLLRARFCAEVIIFDFSVPSSCSSSFRDNFACFRCTTFPIFPRKPSDYRPDTGRKAASFVFACILPSSTFSSFHQAKTACRRQCRSLLRSLLNLSLPLAFLFRNCCKNRQGLLRCVAFSRNPGKNVACLHKRYTPFRTVRRYRSNQSRAFYLAACGADTLRSLLFCVRRRRIRSKASVFRMFRRSFRIFYKSSSEELLL